jgi:hypothetical protein
MKNARKTMKKVREDIKEIQSIVESWQPRRKKTVKRNETAYSQCKEFIEQELERLLTMYRNTVFEEDMRARLIRDFIDFALRRYHGYAIQGSIKSHYNQKGASMASKDCIFEHVIPAGQVRDMLIDGALTINQALNVPTCRVSRDNNKRLNDLGLHDHNSTPFYPFRRYKAAMGNSTFETYNGQVEVNLDTWSLADHYKQFNIT